MKLALRFAGASILLISLAGCSQKVIEITSEPEGALVTLNDVPVGRTPLQTEFTYYGDYDVQARKEGFEPIRTKATASTPIYERAPLDLATSPIPYESVVKWHFKLEPALEKAEPKQQFEEDLITRAKGLREQVDEPAPAKPEAPKEPTPPATLPSDAVKTAPPPPPPA